jgi:hypothetical protein
MRRPPPAEPTPTMHPTRPATLAGAFLGAAVVGWALTNRFYGDIPRLPWLPLVTFLLLAIAEGVTAHATRNRIARRPGTERVDPLVAARLVALAKASSLAGALFGGLYAGLAVYLLDRRDLMAAAARDLPVAAGGLFACAVLVGAALWLEWACRVPPRPGDPPEVLS